MISIDTTQSFMADLSKDKSESYALKIMAEFVIKEPNLAAFIAIVIGARSFQNSVTAAMVALSVYEKMRINQQEADDLKRTTG